MMLKKWSGNPILVPRQDSGWEGCQVRNPAAVFHEDRVHLFYTAADNMTKDHTLRLGHAVSTDGFHFERISMDPVITPSMTEFQGFDAGGVEDPRCVKIDDTFYMTYMARVVPYAQFQYYGVRREDMPENAGVTWTENFRRGGLLVSKDLKNFKRCGPITSDQFYDANVILFPEKINGKFVMMHRPSVLHPSCPDKERPGISICFSDDLQNWHDDKVLIYPQYKWEGKIGGSAPPIKTDEGWLTIYHSVEYPQPGDSSWNTDFKFCYRASVMLLDLEEPWKVIARSSEYIMEPETNFERYGTMNNVVFPTGNVVLGDDLFVYYGCADTVCGVATVPVQELLDYVLKFRTQKQEAIRV